MAVYTAVKHTFQTAAVATGNGAALIVAGLSTVGVQVEGITTATITFEGTIDGVTWYAIQAMNVVDGSVATTATADGLFILSVTGLDQLRARISAWTAGTLVVTGRGITDTAGLSFSDVAGTVDLAAGEEHIGQVGGEGITIALTPTITAGAYAGGDAVGGLLTFPNAGRASAEGSVLIDVIIVDDAGQDAELELWLFNQTFTAMADNAAWAPSEADLENCIAIVSTVGSIWRAAGTPSVVNAEITRRIDITGTSLFGQLVTRGTPTYVATDDLTVKVKLLQD